MTKLSVNLNKIALLRNSRGRDCPSVKGFAARFLDLGAHGITIHPRPDQRHARYSDAYELKALCDERGVELNIEGYPTPEFLSVVKSVKAAQCTLVPDAPNQVTSDHGWDLTRDSAFLREVIADLNAESIRVSLFVDMDCPNVGIAQNLGAARIELYTEPYAETFGTAANQSVWAQFAQTAKAAQDAGLGVNAGHDLNLNNLARFLEIPSILEVSIGHALVVECLEMGIEAVMQEYGEILNGRAQ
jgi:pyridoxine 5-phosphate synthase